MAKGLFTVFSDTQPTTLHNTKPRRAPSTSTNNSRPLAVFSDPKAGLNSGTTTTLGKENVDPYHRSKLSGKQALGGTKPALGSKLAPSAASRPSSQAISLAPASSSGNGVCTGQLRTRILPSFDDPAPAAPVPTSAPSLSMAEVPPSPAYSIASTSSLHSEAQGGALLGTPNSARDSGYARSVSSSPSASEGEEEDGWARRTGGVVEEEKTVKIGAVGSSRRKRSTRKMEMSEKEADRRARGLTESPLAEVTQAFTSLGSFALPNTHAPDSPSPLSTTAHSKPTRRTSPSKSSLAPKPHAASKPYPATQTMRKKKPASSGSVPAALMGGGEGGVRSMRF